MIPIADENPTLRTPVTTYVLLGLLGVVWLCGPGAGFNMEMLVSSVCNYGLVPGELTRQAPLGSGIPLSPGVYCIIDNQWINALTPITSMFLHGGWGHLLGNALFFWVFGNNVEDSMGRLRFLLFYLLCGIVAAFAQVAINPGSPVPMVGASGAISGVLGGYLVLYPRVHVRVLFIIFIFIQIVRVPAYLVLLLWIGYQVVLGIPMLTGLDAEVSSGIAVFAHIGGFAAGVVLVKLFARSDYIARHRAAMRIPRRRFGW